MGEIDHSTTFGRVDAEGTVYVRTAAGERAVGSWQAGSPEEGLAHFARRYDDLATETELLASRLVSGAAEPQQTVSAAKRLKESLTSASVVGDLDALAARLDEVVVAADERLVRAKLEKDAARAQAIARKNELIAQAEKLSDSTQWRVTGEKLHELLDDWKTVHGIDRKTDGELWERFAAARNAFNVRRRQHFAELDAERKQAYVRKQELVAEAESLAESTDWQVTASRLKELMTAWKASGRASKDAEERLWKRFRAAQDTFFTHRSAAFTQRDTEFRENQRKKEALLSEVESLDPVSDAKLTQSRLRDLQRRWDELGRVPREAMSALEGRLRSVQERIRSAADAEWRRATTSENPLLTQMREQVGRATHQVERAKASGDVKKLAAAQEALASKQKFLELAQRSAS